MNKEKTVNELNPVIDNLKKKGKSIDANEMSPMEREELISRIKGLSRAELDLVADSIPDEILVLSLTRRMCRYKGIEESLNNLVKRLEKL